MIHVSAKRINMQSENIITWNETHVPVENLDTNDKINSKPGVEVTEAIIVIIFTFLFFQCRKISNIRCTKSPNFNDSRLVLQLVAFA